LPRRRRARSQRSRTTERQAEASPPSEPRSALSTVAREDADDRSQRAPRRVLAADTATKAAPRHISRDYSYVGGELRRIAITMAVILAGLIGAAIALR